MSYINCPTTDNETIRLKEAQGLKHERLLKTKVNCNVHRKEAVTDPEGIRGVRSSPVCFTIVSFSWVILHQKTNGPVNAHLISRPTLSAKTSFAKIWHCLKMGQSQLRVIIYISFVELKYIMLHATFHDHRTISSVGEDI